MLLLLLGTTALLARAEGGGDVSGKVDTLVVPGFHRNLMHRTLHWLRFPSLCPRGMRSVLACVPSAGREAAVCLEP